MIRVVGPAAFPRGEKPHARHLRRLSWCVAWPTVVITRTAMATTVTARTVTTDSTTAALPWMALLLGTGLAIVCIAVGATLALRASRSRQALADALHDSRARSACLEVLLDGWSWQSDREHRLIGLRPPSGAPAATWSSTNSATSATSVSLAPSAPSASRSAAGFAHVWERFATADVGALRTLLDRAAPLDDVAVHHAASPNGSATAAETGLLRGRPYTDTQGAFAGYHGSYRADHPSTRTSTRTSEVAADVSIPRPPIFNPAVEPGGNGDGTGERESFSYMVSHDLRAPLRVVEGFTKIIKEDYGRLLDRVGNDHLDRVMSAAARMNNMIDALLSLSKLSSEPLARQPVDLSQLASYVVDDLRRQSPDRSVAIEIQPGMQVLGDPTLLRLVIENLLGNAWKYTGKVAHAEIGFVRAPSIPDTFTVHDNGAGFDMRFADRLFSVFQRLHSATDFPGTGVGLASVRRIVRRHGGEIWSEAEVNRGARFHFSLPGSAIGDPTQPRWAP